jgi:hypothetical protein
LENPEDFNAKTPSPAEIAKQLRRLYAFRSPLLRPSIFDLRYSAVPPGSGKVGRSALSSFAALCYRVHASEDGLLAVRRKT